jgi:predicted RNA-binding Zn ribbon-like protein
MDASVIKAATHKLVGGAVCLDFVNTLGAADTEQPSEYLPSYAALVMWSQHAGLLTEPEAQRLVLVAAQHPRAAATTLREAHDLRALLRRIFITVVAGGGAADDDLITLNRLLATAMARTQVMPTARGYAWTWADDPDALDRIGWPLVRSAAELLVNGDLSRLHICAGDRCGWVFVDTSKNRSRRWCDMQDCGNVAKVRRFRTRQHADHDHAE